MLLRRQPLTRMGRKPAGDGEARRPRPGPADGEARHLELLRGCRFLAALPHKRLRQRAAKLHAASFGDGAQIIAQGDAATGMFFIERRRGRSISSSASSGASAARSSLSSIFGRGSTSGPASV